jgi:tetratricopeptide (TPR) repeat protein
MWVERALASVSPLAALLRVALLAGLIGGSPPAQAQTSSRAARLFDAGVSDLKLEKYATACAMLEESYGLEANLGALIALGDCLERWGKLHSAVLRFEALIAAVSADAAASAFRASQLEYARSAVARLRPRVPTLRLIFPTPQEPELRLLLDGETLDLSPPEQEVALDPGRHSIETRAPDRDPWRLELEVSAGEQRDVALELGRPAAPAAPSGGRRSG